MVFFIKSRIFYKFMSFFYIIVLYMPSSLFLFLVPAIFSIFKYFFFSLHLTSKRVMFKKKIIWENPLILKDCFMTARFRQIYIFIRTPLLNLRKVTRPFTKVIVIEKF